MVKVDNRETMRLVTKRFMKMNRKRNVIAVIAIILTALLFTSLFVGSQSLILSKRAVDIEQSMDSSHAGVQNMTKEQAKKALQTAKNSSEVSRSGQAVFLGSGMNPEFQFSTEVRYADKNMAESNKDNGDCKRRSGDLYHSGGIYPADRISILPAVLSYGAKTVAGRSIAAVRK